MSARTLATLASIVAVGATHERIKGKIESMDLFKGSAVVELTIDDERYTVTVAEIASQDDPRTG